MKAIGASPTMSDKLTPVEWEIMETIWDLGGSPSVRDVLERAYPQGEKAYTTVQTIMGTLEKKKLLRRKKIGLVNFYSPVRSRDKLMRAEISTLLARVFGGSVPALADSLLSLENVSLAEIRAIKALLREKERELKDGSS